MRKFLFIFYLLTFCSLGLLYGQEVSTPSVPTPFIQGVNILTGMPQHASTSTIQYEFYKQGVNKLDHGPILLLWGDFRIGKVKSIHIKLSDQATRKIDLIYEKEATHIIEAPHKITIYRYSNSLIRSVEHYNYRMFAPIPLYRTERLFWQTSSNGPQLVSRTLEDANGQIVLCYSFDYNDKGLLIKETLSGDLSGNSTVPCLIDGSGHPQNNGVESYSTSYIYQEDDPDLLAMQIEDNGIVTTFQYNAFKQCTAKLKGNDKHLLSRCFYIYDTEGFLEQTILDDGQGKEFLDLTGVTQRQIIRSKIGQEGKTLGLPLKMETLYWDCETQQEKTLESVEYFYNDQGQIRQQDFYDANHHLRYDLRFNYDNEGNLESTVDSRGEVALKKEAPLQERYNEWGQSIATIDAYGNETNYEYDDFDRLVATTYPAVLDPFDHSYRPETKQNYNICDQLIELIDSKGKKTSFSYNIRGKPTKIIYPDQSCDTFSYFLDGALKEKCLRNGICFYFSRDHLNRVIRSEKRSASGQILQTLHYHYQGELIQTVSDEQTFTTRFLYDGAGRQIGTLQETKEGNRRLEWTFDACGQKNQIQEWFGPSAEDFITKIEQRDMWQNPQATLFQDAQGDLKYRITHQNNSPLNDIIHTQVSSTCNDLGQYVKQEEKVDAYGIRHLFTYDALERLVQLSKYNSMGHQLSETSYRYDAQGNKALERHQVLVDSQVTRVFSIQWEYDVCRRLIAIIEGDQDQSKRTSYHYNQYGQIDCITKPDGNRLLYTYDEKGQLKSFEASDQSFGYKYFYDHLQRLVEIQDFCHGLTQHRRYNAFHDLIEDQLSSTISVKHHYDLAGRHTGLTLPDQSKIAYHYDGPLLSKVERIGLDDQSSYSHRYVYNQEGDLKNCDLIKNVGKIDYTYNHQNRLIAISSPWLSQSVDENGFDLYGRILSMTTKDVLGTEYDHYSYQDDGQLATEKDHEYSYDSLFNRLTDNHQEWIVNHLNQLIQTPSAAYRYDANGNMVEKQQNQEKTIYRYDALDRLIRVEFPEQKAITFVYDAFHRRISQQTWEWRSYQKDWMLKDSEQFIYDGLKEIGKADKQNQLIELRILGQGQGAELGAAIALELKGRTYVPLHDIRGSICCLIDSENQNIVEYYRYSAYGQETIFDGAGRQIEISQVDNPWHFCSKRLEKDTNLIFFGKRYYDSSIGRWLTPDPLFFYDTPNLYAFVRNDPMNHSDLYGLFSISQLWDKVTDVFFTCFNYLRVNAQNTKARLMTELRLPSSFGKALEKTGKIIFGETIYLLMGPHFEETHVDTYGEIEISDKVRVTFINGILNTRQMMHDTLTMISESHGGVKVHYVFRPTEGWTWDISRAIMIRTAFSLGFRSMHAHLLARMWRDLIQDMGGVNSGGTIIHYAHSLGGSETDRARDLLTPEEQKMIRVFTFGSATLIRNVGYQSVVNNISVKDGVSSFFLEPLGHLRNFFDSNSNIKTHGSFFSWPCWPTDHLMNGPTYAPVLQQLGTQFLAEFSPAYMTNSM